MIYRSHNQEFATLFKTLRLRAGFFTLQSLSSELNNEGFHIDPSLLSHWQRGARLPKDRATILLLLQVFIKGKGILSIEEANKFCESSGMGYLTKLEITKLFSGLVPDVNETKLIPNANTKVYFSAAIAQANEFEKNYRMIVNALKEKGCLVQADHIIGITLESLKNQPSQQRIDYYRKFLNWVEDADMVVLEGSYPSTINIGHELTVALNKKKPVILLYKTGRDFIFLQGIRSDYLFLVEYSDQNLFETVQSMLHFVQSQV